MPHLLICTTVLSWTMVLFSTTEAGTIITVAGTGKTPVNGSAGAALDLNLGNPFGVEVGPEGNLYICEVSNHRVWKLDRDKGTLQVIAGTGKKGYSGDGGLATDALLNEPYEVRFDAAGNMFFVEMQNHLVRRVDAKTRRITTVAGTGEAGFGGDGGPATEAKFRSPHSIALDGHGNLYIADIGGNHRIRRVDLTMFAWFIMATVKKLPSDGALALGMPMLGPRALAIEGDNLWIALRSGHSIWRLDLKSGKLEHIAGTGAQGYSGDGGPGLNATFNGPKGIAVGPQGNIYVVDTENQVIRKIHRNDHTVETVVGIGPKHRGYNGDQQLATKASLARPHGICVDQRGRIYIGDSENHRVRQVTQP